MVCNHKNWIKDEFDINALCLDCGKEIKKL